MATTNKINSILDKDFTMKGFAQTTIAPINEYFRKLRDHRTTEGSYIVAAMRTGDSVAEMCTNDGSDVTLELSRRKLISASKKTAVKLAGCTTHYFSGDELDQIPDYEIAFGDFPAVKAVPSRPRVDLDDDESDSDDGIDMDSSITIESQTLVIPAIRTIRKRARYLQAVVQAAKNKFGTPERTGANLLVVRKFLFDQMTAHKLRPTAIHEHIASCVELVFILSDAEYAASRLRDDRESRRRSGRLTTYEKCCDYVLGRKTYVSPTHLDA